VTVILTRLMGGMGNQMFQYAAGRSLALRLQTELMLDTQWYALAHTDKTTPRSFELAVFDLPDATVWCPGMRTPDYDLRDPYFTYNAAFEWVSDDTRLVGQWQSPQYFADYADVIRRDFTFRADASEGNQRLLARITADPSAVSLHVRRTDYVTWPGNQPVMGFVGESYYERAVAWVRERIAQPTFYIFSDEPAWCRQHLKLGDASVYVDGNVGADSYLDMWLMSHCKHHIIANSTFSWWGAWLNPNAEKLVVAPACWFSDPSMDARDLLPSTWTRL
jgi:hypothetical protein